MTIDDMLRMIRFNTQESNEAQVSDQMILDALNRAKNYSYDLMSKHYLDPLLKYEDITTSDQQLSIPETTFQDRVVKVEYLEISSGRWLAVPQVTFRELGKVSTTTTKQIPDVWAIIKRKIHFDSPIGSNTFRVWYIEDVGDLVKEQGRVDSITTSLENPSDGPFITVDVVGSDIDVSDSYKKYISVIDSSTGELKSSFQVEEVNGTQIKFKATPERAKVLNVPVSGEAEIDAEDPVIELDDYICILGGTCVVYFEQPQANFIIQYATNEIRDSLGALKSGQENRLNKLEKAITSTKAGRQTTKRINNRSPIWRKTKSRRNIRR